MSQVSKDNMRGIEGIPVIIRFKTLSGKDNLIISCSIEGIPVIIRFKTHILLVVHFF